MFSSNYLKQAFIDSTAIGAPEHYLLPKLNFSGFFIETDTGDAGADEAENEQSEQKNANEIINKAWADAARILAAAKDEALTFVKKTEAETDELCAEKYNSALESGYKEGLLRGKTDAQNEISKALGELRVISDRLSDERREILQSSQKLILDLASEMAGKITGDSFVKDEKVFVAMFRRAVKDIPPAQKLKVTIAEKDYNLMSFDPQKLLALAEGFNSIELCCDKAAQEGTLKVETAIMLLDAGINTQIDMLKKEIAKTF